MFRDPWYSVFETHLVTITEPYMIAYDWDTEKQAENEAEAEWIIDYLEPGEEPLEPISDIYYPVIVEALDNIHHHEEKYSPDTYSTQSNKLGAVLALSIYWRDALRDLLPTGSAGVVVCFENACDVPPFAYEISGPVARYLGTGEYNSTFKEDSELSITTNLMDVWQYGIKETSYTGIPINEDSCPFFLRVYPAESSYEEFMDGNDQTVYIILVLVLSVSVLTIAFTLMFFFLYDRLVRNEIRSKINLLDAKRNFVRFVSHEVRTPLNTVSMGLALMHQDLQSRERHLIRENGSGSDANVDSTNNGIVTTEDLSRWSSLTQEVSHNTDVAVGVLNDLLNIDKIQMGAFKLEMEILPVWDLIEETTLEFHMMAAKQKTDLKLDLMGLAESRDVETAITTASMLPPSVLKQKLVGDPQRIRQVLRNLLSNAIKFSKNRSVTVKVSVRDPISKSKDIQALNESKLTDGSRVGILMNGRVVIDVIDTGVGMTPVQLETVFDVGTQFNANKLQSGGGSGLGLAFAKAITEQHGGSLRVYSDGRDKGTTFRLDLPLYHSDGEEKNSMSSSSSSNENENDEALPPSPSMTSSKLETTTIREENLEPMRILVVDDALMNRKLLIRLLKANGHSCGEAENGQALIDTIGACRNDESEEGQAVQYDCILVDYEMPVMNGPEACKAIREMGYAGFVVGVTGNLLPEDIGYFMDCGADYVLPKPFKYKELEQLLIEQGLFAVS
jgi:signal transduction histidine kinase